MNPELIEFSLILLIYSCSSYYIFNLVYQTQPKPFIDELFHIPQGLKYCHGNFTEWDPKITTLPGLYLVSFGVLQLAGLINNSSICSGYNLRMVNVLFSVFSMCLVYSIASFSNPVKKGNGNSRMALWTSFNISILPICFLFNFFYYTETVSTFFFLFMYRMHMSKNFWIAAILGACSILIRQTNIIWVGYLLIDLLKDMSGLILIRRRKTSFNEFVNLFWVFKYLWNEKKVTPHLLQFLVNSCGYIIVCLLFLIFVLLNKGIVVGDRAAHEPVIHFCQMFYFSLFCIFFGCFHYIEKVKSFIEWSIKNPKIVILATTVCIIVVYFNSLVHPYLLADNRHYTFYLWKKVYESNYGLRYILIPVYFFGFYCMNVSLRINRKIEFWLCTIMCLVPQKLFDFRYFILPFIIFRLQLRCKIWWHLSLETIFFISLNCATFYIFFNKKFYWNDSNEIQRIIW